MKQEQLLNVIEGIREEILNLLVNKNLANDREAKRTIRSINNMFEQLDLEIEDVIPEEVMNYYFKGVDEASHMLKRSGINPVGGISSSITASGKVAVGFQTRVHLNAVAEVTDNLMLDLKAAIRTARRNTSVSIEDTLSAVKKDIQGGIIKGNARKEITKRVAESFNENGMTSFITRDGKRLPLDFYSQVTVRTNLKVANLKGAGNRYIESGVDTYRVTGNTPTCHQCAPLRGIVFTSNPNNTDFTYMAHEDILRHPNCQCSFYPVVIEYEAEEQLDKFKEESKAFDPNEDTRSKHMRDEYERDQDRKRRRNDEKKQYARYKAVLGDDAPKTLGGFRRSKKSNSDNFKKLMKDYREANKTII